LGFLATVSPLQVQEEEEGTPSTSDGGYTPLCAATLKTALLDRLLAAMGDYSTDNRGEAVWSVWANPHTP